MDQDAHALFEQFLAICVGRKTYDDDEQWIANLDAAIAPLCQVAGLDFAAQEQD